MAYLGSKKPLGVIEQTCGTRLIIEAFVLLIYPLDDWGYSLRIAPEGKAG